MLAWSPTTVQSVSSNMQDRGINEFGLTPRLCSHHSPYAFIYSLPTMARFNKKVPSVSATPVVNYAGGWSVKHDERMELFLLASTCFLDNQFYRSAKETMQRIMYLIDHVPVQFVIDLSLYVRHELGLRSVTHFMAAYLATKLQGTKIGKLYYQDIIGRPDDMGEILSCFKDILKQEALPNTMRKGFAAYLESLYDYKLGKYKMIGKDFNIYDIVNLCHPKQTQPIKRLMTGTLKAPRTWEVLLSEAGAHPVAKAQVWADLIVRDELGYLALLRNLKNIKEQAAPLMFQYALDHLQEKNRIQESRVMPFQFMTAIKRLKVLGHRKLNTALGNALNTIVENATKVTDGRLLIAIDVSGSMYGLAPNTKNVIEHASILAAALWKTNPNAELFMFNDKLVQLNLRNTMDVTSITEDIQEWGKSNMGGTNIAQVLDRARVECTAGKPYAAVILISDMQDWIQPQALQVVAHSVQCPVIMLDCAGYGTKIARGIYTVGGLTDKVFKLMQLIVDGETNILNYISSTPKRVVKGDLTTSL